MCVPVSGWPSVSVMARPDHANQPLSQAEIDAISDRLKKGQFLDDQYRSRLFRPSKEYELTYAAKQSKGSVLAETMGVPLQTLKQYGQPDGGWINKLILGDNLQILKTLLEMKEDGALKNADGTDGARLCYIDPPFATRQEFKGKKGERAYQDKVAGAAFVEFLRKRLIFIREVLSDDGVICVHLDWRKSHYVKIILDEVFGEHNFQNEIVWRYSGWNKKLQSYFERRHDILLYYSKSATPLFHSLSEPWKSKQEYLKVRKQKLLVDEDGREYVLSDAGGGKRVKRYIEEAMIAGRPSDDVWNLDKLNNSSKESVDYPTQKPEALLERVIAAFSNPGDIVLDCFLGSGTTAVVADKMGRRWVGADSGKFAAYTAQSRLLAKSAASGSTPTTQPFELCTAGLYDNTLIEDLSFEDFKRFSLQLFGCSDEPGEVGPIPMAGTRKGAPVHIFPFNETDAVMGREYIESLHEHIGGLVSGSVCVIAPVSACDPALFENIVELPKPGGGRLSYFILRVPYSVIEALHERGFEHLEQPTSADDVNNALDGYGFDFMEQPEVVASVTRDGDAMTIQIEKFMHGGLDPDDFEELEDAGRDDLAMVMVDTDEDDGIFNIREFFFGADLKQDDWKFRLDTSNCGDRVLLIYLDTHGNESREVVDVKVAAPTKKAKAKAKR